MSRTTALPPHFLAAESKVKNSMITEGCEIHGNVEHSIIFHNVHIGKNSEVKDSVIMNDVTIGDNVIINKAIIGDGAVIEDNVQINTTSSKDNPYLNTKICDNDLSLIGPGVTIGKNNKIAKLSMVDKSIAAKGGK